MGNRVLETRVQRTGLTDHPDLLTCGTQQRDWEDGEGGDSSIGSSQASLAFRGAPTSRPIHHAMNNKALISWTPRVVWAYHRFPAFGTGPTGICGTRLPSCDQVEDFLMQPPAGLLRLLLEPDLLAM
ncbi:uncharacterized protein LOC143440938 isoform X2 [Arvicanthis niloticus]|uniref:uncharacterized protein LOC143311043 isoform X2 n=1 Tax=Arvicanthis niloticus TaxID=61156 RepID=UPI00402BD449